MRERLATFIRGLRTMRPAAGFDWYWKLGPFIEWTDPALEEGERFHFEKMGIGLGPLWLGLKDSD